MYKLLQTLMRCLLIPYFLKQSHSLFLSTLSKAFSWSMNATLQVLLCSIALSVSCLNVNIASVQLLFHLKPIRASESFSSIVGLSLFSMILAYIFPTWLSSEIPNSYYIPSCCLCFSKLVWLLLFANLLVFLGSPMRFGRFV